LGNEKKQNKTKLKIFREDKLISKSELAKKADISPITLERIEQGQACRIETKRKIIMALGLTIEQKNLVFEEE
jgi:DNA-binding XRE family transcriptional regulator